MTAADPYRRRVQALGVHADLRLTRMGWAVAGLWVDHPGAQIHQIPQVVAVIGAEIDRLMREATP